MIEIIIGLVAVAIIGYQRYKLISMRAEVIRVERLLLHKRITDSMARMKERTVFID